MRQRVVLLGGGWRALLDAHAQTVTLRLRSPLVAPVTGLRPVLRRGDDRPVPASTASCAPECRVVALPEYDAFALTRFDDVWRVLTDRDRFSIFEGPVFHRAGAAPPPRRTTRPTVGAAPAADVLDARPAGAHAAAPGDARAVPAARGRAAGGHRARARAGAARRARRAATSSTCVTTTRRRSPRRSRRCSSGSRSRTPSCWSAGSTRSSHASPTSPASAPRARRRTSSCTPTSSSWSPSGGRTRDGDGPPDLIDDLCAYAGAHGPLDDAEIAVQLSTLFIGGSETLPKTVAGGATSLARARAARRAGRRTRRRSPARSRRCSATSSRCSSSGAR